MVCNKQNIMFQSNLERIPPDLIIQLPTRGQEPDVTLDKFLEELKTSIHNKTENFKHIKLCIGVNSKDAENIQKNYKNILSQIEQFNKENNGKIPLSVTVMGFKWSVESDKHPEEAQKIIPFGSFRNFLFKKILSETQNLDKNCRFISMDADTTLNEHAVDNLLKLNADEFITMPYNIPNTEKSNPNNQATQKAFDLHWRIQNAVGKENESFAYPAEPCLLIGSAGLKKLKALSKKGKHIFGQTDCEGRYIFRHLKNAHCHFKAVPNPKQSVEFHNFQRFHVNNRDIKTRDDFIKSLSSLAKQSQNMFGIDFFARQIAFANGVHPATITRAALSLYLPKLMKEKGIGLKDYKEIITFLEKGNPEPKKQILKDIADKFSEIIDEIKNIYPQEKSKSITDAILQSCNAVYNFATEAAFKNKEKFNNGNIFSNILNGYLIEEKSSEQETKGRATNNYDRQSKRARHEYPQDLTAQYNEFRNNQVSVVTQSQGVNLNLSQPIPKKREANQLQADYVNVTQTIPKKRRTDNTSTQAEEKVTKDRILEEAQAIFNQPIVNSNN